MNKAFIFAYRVFKKDRRSSTYSFLLASLILPITTVVVLFATKRVVDIVQASAVHRSYTQMLMMVIQLVVILYINSINSSLQAISYTKLIEFSEVEEERVILDKNNKLCLEDLDSPKIKNMREKAKRFSFMTAFEQQVSYFSNLIEVISLIAILLYYHCFLLVAAVVMFLMICSNITKILARNKEKVYQKQTRMNRVCDYLFDQLTSRDNIMEIRVYGMFKYLSGKMLKIMIKNQKEIHKQVCTVEFVNVLQNLAMAILDSGSVILIVISSSNNIKTAGTFVILIQIVNELFSKIQALISCHSNVKASQIQYEAFSKFMDLPTVNKASLYLEKDKDGVEIDAYNISFRYRDNDFDTLNNVSLHIYPGEKVAIVGQNGGGKSTLIKLIMGLYEPRSGSIHWKMGGKEISIKDTVNVFRIVFQDFLKLLRTVRENIGMGNISNINNDNKLVNALKSADAKGIPVEFETKLGPEFGGQDLSGGQWQKLALARAYFSGHLVTIFDEPTAALDPYAEYEAFQSFIKLSEDTTAIIVTHRLYITKQVDRIIVLDKGKIVETGSHEELMKSNGKYAKMYNAQVSFYE